MDFLKLVDAREMGTKPGNGWGVFPYVKCDMCYYAWTATAIINTKGKECPNCGYYDPDAIWIELSEVKGESAFLNPVGQDYSIVNLN